jgi:hypothetical protein
MTAGMIQQLSSHEKILIDITPDRADETIILRDDVRPWSEQQQQ